MKVSDLFRAFVSKLWSAQALDARMRSELLNISHALDDGKVSTEKAGLDFQKILSSGTGKPVIEGIETFISKVNVSFELQRLLASPHLAACLDVIKQYDERVHFLEPAIEFKVNHQESYSTLRLSNQDRTLSPEIILLYGIGLLSLFDRICDCKTALKNIFVPVSFKNDLAFISPSRLYSCDVQYRGKSLEIQFHRNKISCPSVFYQPTTFHSWVNELEITSNQTEVTAPFTNKLRACIQSSAAPASLKLEEVAASLNKSATHFRRILKKEGTSFRYYSSKIIASMAIEKLMLNEPIESVAAELGYSERTAFERFIKNFLGIKAVTIKRAGMRLCQVQQYSPAPYHTQSYHSKAFSIFSSVEKHFGDQLRTPGLHELCNAKNIIKLCDKIICEIGLSLQDYYQISLLTGLLKCLPEQWEWGKAKKSEVKISGEIGSLIIQSHIVLFIGLSFTLKKSHPDANFVHKILLTSENWNEFCERYKSTFKIGFYETCAVRMAQHGFPTCITKEVSLLDKKSSDVVKDTTIEKHQALIFSLIEKSKGTTNPRAMYQESA